MATMQSVSAKGNRDSLPRESFPAQAAGRSSIGEARTECDAAYEQGVGYLRHGDGAAAIPWLQRAVALGPNRPELHGTLGIALTGQQRWIEAEACFRVVVDLRPDAAEARNDLGNVLRLQGRLNEAVTCFEEAVALRADCVEAYLNLGLVLIACKDWEQAVSVLQRAIGLRPGLAGGHYHLASALSALAGWDEAIRHYQEALRLRPGSAEIHSGLANALRSIGKPAEALTHYLRALEIRPDAVEVHASLAETLAVQGQRTEAVNYVWQVLRHRPPTYATYATLGATLLKLGQAEDAERCLRSALQLSPDNPETLNNLGTALWERGALEHAEASYRRALEIRPDDPDVLNNLGNVLWELKQVDEAEACYRQVLALRPDSAQGHLNLGILLTGQGKLDAGAAQIQQSIRIRPESPAAYNGLGMTLARQGKLDEAMACYERALKIQPDFAESRRNRAMTWLVRGDFERGWPEHEWRWKCRGHQMQPFSQPFWQGEDLVGKTILLHAEQGFGDTLQFIRYAPVVKERGARVIVVCPDPLVRLLVESPGIDELYAASSTLPDFDFHAPLMSLPAILKTTLETIPATVPYLLADEEEGVEVWKQELAALPGFKIGVAWQGNPAHRLDRDRSFPLTALAPLGVTEGLHLISLQKGFGTEQLRSLNGRFPIHELTGFEQGGGDFLETARLIKSLDLVVTPDSAIAHLSGGLGVPVWLALPAVSECRWLLDREDSPWYPSMRLFRQTEPGEWSGVFRRMADALARRTH